MFLLELLFRYMHILAAIALVGGTIYLRISVVPGLAALDEPARRRFQEAARRPWAILVMVTSLFLLVSGLTNMFLNIARFEFPDKADGGSGTWLALQLFLALPIFFIAARLAGRSEGAAKFREKQKLWLTVNVVLAIVVVCLGGLARFERREPKPPKNEPAPAAVERQAPAQAVSALPARSASQCS